MSITLHTLTRLRHPKWLAQAINSVPAGVKHKLIFCTDDFVSNRWAGLQLDELVGAVDDDDVLRAEGLHACVAALKATGAGIAFTYEAKMDETGRHFPPQHQAYSTRDVAMHPNVLHHFALMRSECLSMEIVDIARRFHSGSIDWLSKAWVALKHGAVQVPVVGYDWRLHDGCMSREAPEVRGVAENLDAIRKITLSWMKNDAPIRQHVPR
jgi:hypothetical protein